MNKNYKIGFGIIVVIVLILLGYYLISPVFNNIEVNQSIDAGEVLVSGKFMESAHEVSGEAKVIESGDKKVLRFEDFETVNGPNLHIYLSSDLDANDFLDLGEIKATKGNVNYDLPDNIDLEKYGKVLVWCVPFEVRFSYAELS